MAASQTPDPNMTLTIRPRTTPPRADRVPRSYLLVIEDRGSSLFPLPPSGEVVIGRAREADLCLLDPGASRRHARLTIADGLIRIADLNSHNGTRVNGEPIAAGCVLASGDVIGIRETLL